jgi:hypothetical protein
MALNMFIIDFTKVKGQDSQNYRTVAQNSALQVNKNFLNTALIFGKLCKVQQ